MTDHSDKDTLKACEEVLSEVKAYAAHIKKMHNEIQLMLDQNKQLKSDVDAIQHEEVQTRLLRLASKAAKKAAKKSIAKAKIREKLYSQNNDS